MAMVVDPVCGMRIDSEEAAGSGNLLPGDRLVSTGPTGAADFTVGPMPAKTLPVASAAGPAVAGRNCDRGPVADSSRQLAIAIPASAIAQALLILGERFRDWIAEKAPKIRCIETLERKCLSRPQF